MVAALLEWFLWLAAFCYCLVKVYNKADHWSIKILAVAMIVFFVAFRLAFPLLSMFPQSLISVCYKECISPSHGRHATLPCNNHSILSQRNGICLAVVRVLDLRSALDRTVAFVRPQASNKFVRKNKED